ncbi:MAG: hypothetical protein JW783_00610 [Bacteroidales bacterium]|nr:hypothetical protein [Bacteroidales bacterium]MBN2748523.1 hypothetical protein [Bacteroidales bacterium]
MSKNDTIFTLNARDNIYLELSYKDSSPEEIYKEVNSVFDIFIESLESINIDYRKLKNGLIPSKQRNEIALIFDIPQSGLSVYDYNILSKIFPLLEKQSTHSILIGDYTGGHSLKHMLHSLFFEHIIQINPTIYQYHNQYFLVYINNLSKSMVQNLVDRLKKYKYFTGYFDLTYSSRIKTYLSTILIPKFIKHKTTLILPDPYETLIIDEIEADELTCDYEELGFKCKFVHSAYYNIFLSYKIERKVLKNLEKDRTFSLNTLTSSVIDISECDIEIEPSKLDYLHEKKTNNIERAGFLNSTTNELAEIIKEKLEQNYIYNLSFLENFNTMKFNIIIEVPRFGPHKLMKLLLALEYKPEQRTLRLITMY